MENPKILALYLPQFHAIPENDKWWGKGFTEWTNTKKAKPLFKDHIQPKVPLNDNFYNLLDGSSQEWQSKLAQEYGVYGFCYYHYWFNGKLLLEKPMENMLKNPNVTIPFCISWANEPWARTWDGKDKEVLMPQTYGKEEAWETHFNYLLQFFKDSRYILKNNKPMFLIYRTVSIPDCDEMIAYWDKKCKENGFAGIYIVETINSFQKDSNLTKSEAVMEFEPMLTIRHYLPIYKQAQRYIKKRLKMLDTLDYDYVWNNITKRDTRYNKDKFFGAFVAWDNTARKGKNGLIVKDDTPEKFHKNFELQYNKAKNAQSEFIFINAWNEWAEGTYLEPDETKNYEYLTIIKEVVGYDKK